MWSWVAQARESRAAPTEAHGEAPKPRASSRGDGVRGGERRTWRLRCRSNRNFRTADASTKFSRNQSKSYTLEEER